MNSSIEQTPKIPEFLQDYLISQYSKEDMAKIIQGYSKDRKVTLRVNTLKSSIEKVKKALEEAYIDVIDENNGNCIHEPIKYTEVPWSKEALIIENAKEADLQKLDIYENGEIYLQSLSSMLPPIILNPMPEEDILDMCAAPGGKTTQISALTHNLAHITACEMNNIRAERLKYNLEKQGVTSAFVMQKDARKIDDFFSFDRILLDAPCSGSGTLNFNDKNVYKYLTKELVEKSSRTQLNLLRKAVNLLKPGKEMVYSTCSILSEENEKIVEKVMKDGKVEIVPICFER